MRRLIRWSTLIGWMSGLVLIVSGCAAPIGVHYVDRSVAYHSLAGNVLSRERPSSFSARELVNLNLYLRFEEDPVGALAEVHAGLVGAPAPFIGKLSGKFSFVRLPTNPVLEQIYLRTSLGKQQYGWAGADTETYAVPAAILGLDKRDENT